MGRTIFRNYYYKGHMDKTNGEGGNNGGRWVWFWLGRKGEEKMQRTVSEQQ